MRKKLAILALCFMAFTAFSQEVPTIKFGKILLKDVEMTSYEKDSSAEAAILYDNANVRFSIGETGSSFYLKMTKEYFFRIKIFKKSGLSRASREITYMRNGTTENNEFVTDIEAITYNMENGGLSETKLDKKSILEEKLVNDYYRKKITFPNVKEGSVIDFHYTVVTPFSIAIEPPTWYFQTDIPVVWSDYSITIPSHFYYNVIMGGYLPLYLNEKKNVNVDMGHTTYNTYGMAYRFVMKDIPAFKNEKFITTPNDYLSKIDFEMANYALPSGFSKSFTLTWEDLDKTLLSTDTFGGQLKKGGIVKEEVEAFKAITNADQKAKAIYDYVKSTYKWDENERFFTSDALKKVVANKQGNSAEINLILLNMLNESGINAYPVLLSTRSHGHISEFYPLIDRFNYVIVAIEANDGKLTLLDATDPLIPYGMLPERCLNGTGRLIKKVGEGAFIPLDTKIKYVILEDIKGTINSDDGTIEGDYLVKTKGYAAHDLIEENKNKEESAILKEVKSKHHELEISKFGYSIEKEPELQTTTSFHFATTDNIPNPSIIYFDPMQGGKVEENPFKAKERIYPVDFGWTSNQTYIGKFTLPKGFVIEEKPADLALALPNKGGRFLFSTKFDETENVFTITSLIVLNKAIYSADEYHFLKEFYDQIVKKHGEQVVLKAKP